MSETYYCSLIKVYPRHGQGIHAYVLCKDEQEVESVLRHAERRGLEALSILEEDRLIMDGETFIHHFRQR